VFGILFHVRCRLLSFIEVLNQNCMYFSFAPCTPHILQFHSSLHKFLYSAMLISLRTALFPPTICSYRHFSVCG
jgi:hypothetical protein